MAMMLRVMTIVEFTLGGFTIGDPTKSLCEHFIIHPS